jgi:hypothetical protein
LGVGWVIENQRLLTISNTHPNTNDYSTPQHVEIIQPVPPYFGGKSSSHMCVGVTVLPFSFFIYRIFGENQQN